MSLPHQILKRYWKFSKFRPHQLEIIEAVLDQQDCIALLPTAGGKSICFQIPALIKEGICIVISPLIALMQDQVKGLNAKGIKATALTNLDHLGDLERILDNCIYGDYKFLYLSPERLQNTLVQERIKSMDVHLIAVDEAHCISQWGHDFRPAYRSIKDIRSLCPKATVLALTATATKKVICDIDEQLALKQSKLFKGSFFRKNLSYKTIIFEDKNFKIKALLKNNKQSAIVYTSSRRATQQLAQMLNLNGISSGYYHGGLSNKEKEHQYNQWISDKTNVIVATNAFGMGIDKANVSLVVHTDIPESLEHYFQEAGRAGRNQDKAEAVLLIGTNDIQNTQKWRIDQIVDVTYIKLIYKKLFTYFQIAYGELSEEKHGFNFDAFCTLYGLAKRKTYNSLKILERHGLIVFEEYFKNKVTIFFLVNHNTLHKSFEHNDKLRLIVTSILRTYEGVNSQETNIDIGKVAKTLHLNEDEIIENLNALDAKEIVRFKCGNSDAQITFVQPREDDRAINRISKMVSTQNKNKLKKIKAVIHYIENNSVCKSQQLLRYFDEPESMPCGTCNVCTENKGRSHNSFEKDNVVLILEALKVKPMTSRELVSNLSISSNEVIAILRHLLEVEQIQQSQINEFQIKCP